MNLDDLRRLVAGGGMGWTPRAFWTGRDQVRTRFRDRVVRPLLDAGWLEMTVPDKPRSLKQRYRIRKEKSAICWSSALNRA